MSGGRRGVPAVQMRRGGQVLAVALALALALGGCAGPTLRARAYAQRNGMTAGVIQGARFQHEIFTKGAAMRAAPTPDATVDSAMLYVFIEGDGSPWVDAGTRIAKDPTPHRPLALELAAATPHACVLGRPVTSSLASRRSARRICGPLAATRPKWWTAWLPPSPVTPQPMTIRRSS